MNIIADTHSHTLICNHAYSTLLENVIAAKSKGLKFLANTEHCPAIPGAPHRWYFSNQNAYPRKIENVIVLKGAEVNILDYNGSLDLAPKDLKWLDWVIASMHQLVLISGRKQDHTKAWLNIAENPDVDVIGHCGDGRYNFDHDLVIKAFAKYNKIVEINNHSFSSRPGSSENCVEIAKLCMKYGVNIVVSSDAHSCFQIGCFEKSLQMLDKIGFPEELILNANYDRFYAAAKEKSPENLE